MSHFAKFYDLSFTIAKDIGRITRDHGVGTKGPLRYTHSVAIIANLHQLLARLAVFRRDGLATPTLVVCWRITVKVGEGALDGWCMVSSFAEQCRVMANFWAPGVLLTTPRFSSVSSARSSASSCGYLRLQTLATSACWLGRLWKRPNALKGFVPSCFSRKCLLFKYMAKRWRTYETGTRKDWCQRGEHIEG
jgi:hypothetical protein